MVVGQQLAYPSPSFSHRQDSLLDHFEPDRSTLPIQHFVEWFSGDALDSIWTQFNRDGTGTHSMADAANEGFQYVTDNGTNDSGGIDMNGIHHYEPTASVCISIFRKENSASAQVIMAMAEGSAGDYSSGNDYYQIQNITTSGIRILSRNNTNASATSTSLGQDTVYHIYKTEIKSSSLTGHVDGVLEATKTDFLPAVKLQPSWRMLTLTTTVKTGHITYFEAYNT